MMTRRSLKRQTMPKFENEKKKTEVSKLNLRRKGDWQNEAQGLSEAEREKAPSLKVTRSKDHQNAPIKRKVSSKGNLEKERGQITCLRQSCQIIAKRQSK
ncbi:Hypothetical_protein [Hexamita inflata]|uniref:Hypothetical_protein n=1 Tax=Hexamita inflata TaxID=28002 RepID=A0AA86RBS3_9EUKA|nr:Hypothetical protein HINF_LOCUS60942 [Hexamita inflata]